MGPAPIRAEEVSKATERPCGQHMLARFGVLHRILPNITPHVPLFGLANLNANSNKNINLALKRRARLRAAPYRNRVRSSMAEC